MTTTKRVSQSEARERISRLLFSLAEAGALASSLVAPGMVEVLDRFMPSTSDVERKRVAGYLQAKRLINVSEKSSGEIELTLTIAGWKRVQRYRIDSLSLRRPSRWDGKWRVVMFDIPERSKAGRDATTRKLRELGLHQWQRSVWVYPYECQDEVGMLAQLYGVDQYVMYMVVEHTSADLSLHRHFRSLIEGRD